jgi:aspartate-semialdehyde dehydrogenase
MFKGKVVVVGATGNVGRNVVEMLLNSKIFNPAGIRLTGSERSAGSVMKVNGLDFIIQNTADIAFEKNELCIFNTEADVSSLYIPIALAAGAYVVDSSSHYRMDRDVPLIVPPVNISEIDILKHKLFSHSNCIVSPIATAIAPLHKKFHLERVIASTYQSTSGAGKKAMDECFRATKEFCETKTVKGSESFPRPIPFNIIPQIGSFDGEGFASEETKIANELRKVISKEIFVSATCVRVPVLIGHSTSLSLRFKDDCKLMDVVDVLDGSASIILDKDSYKTPIEIVGQDKVFISRIRSDECNGERWFHMWVCSDNLRVGAATDSFEIAKAIANYL